MEMQVSKVSWRASSLSEPMPSWCSERRPLPWRGLVPALAVVCLGSFAVLPACLPPVLLVRSQMRSWVLVPMQALMVQWP